MSEKRPRKASPATRAPTIGHPGWPFKRPPDDSFRRDFLTTDGHGAGIVHHAVVNLDRPAHAARFQIPPELLGRLVLQLEDYSDWPRHSSLEVATVGLKLNTPPPDHLPIAHGGMLFGYPDCVVIPYILAVYQAARTRNTIGYGVIWSPLSTPNFVEERLEGFDVRVPGFKPEHLKGAIKALKALGGIRNAPGGQPGQFDEANEPQFFQELSDAVHRVVRGGDRVNYSSLARHKLADRRTVQKYVELFGYDLGVLEAEAIRCTQDRGLCTVHVRRRGEFKKKRP